MVPQMHTEVWEHAKGRVTPPTVTDGAAECARAVLVDEFGHRPAQQVAAHRCKMVIGMLTLFHIRGSPATQREYLEF